MKAFMYWLSHVFIVKNNLPIKWLCYMRWGSRWGE